MKSYTNLEQSKILRQFLPIESADMLFQLGEDKYADSIRVPLTKAHWGQMMPNINPCWSLDALLNVLPRFIDFGTHYTFLLIYPIQNLGWVVEYSNNNDDVDFDFDNKNLIDACYEMILKLHEMNLL